MGVNAPTMRISARFTQAGEHRSSPDLEDRVPTFRTTTGVDLAYSDVGAGPALVWIPGTGLTGATWQRQVDHFRAGHRCISVDIRGAGGTTGGPEQFGVGDMADDVVELVAALDISSATLIGVSLGAAIAQEAALREPERVERLVLVASWSSSARERHIRRHFESRLYALEHGPLDVFAQFAFWMSSYTLMDTEPELQARVEQELVAGMSTDRAGIAAHFRADLGHETRDRLGQIACRTLVVHGDEDLITLPAYNRLVAELIPDSILVEIPAAGHLMWLERPQALTTAISAFLGSSS